MSPSTDTKPAREGLGFLLADTTRLIRRVGARYLEAHQLTLAQVRALKYVSHFQGIRQVELADMLEIQPITLARLIDQLAESGLVERRPDAKDRRAFQLFLTSAADPIIEQVSQISADFQAKALVGLTPEQVETLFTCLDHVRNNLSELLR